MGFNLIYWNPIYAVNTFWKVLFRRNVEIYEKTAVFPGGYGWIGEIHTGGYDQIGVYRVKLIFKQYQHR